MANGNDPRKQEALMKRLNDMIRSVQDEGILDHYYGVMDNLKDGNPTFITDVIPIFCSEAEASIRTIHRILDQPVVDYGQLEIIGFKLKGGGSCIGGNRLTLACINFVRAIEEKSRQRCRLAVEEIKREYYVLHTRLNQILKMEMTIMGLETGESSSHRRS